LSLGLLCCLEEAPAQVVDPILLDDRTSNPLGKVDSVAASSRLAGVDDPLEAFGRPSGPIEGGTFLFGDGRGIVQETLTWTTSEPVTLTGLRVAGGAGGPQVQDGRRIGAVEIYADTNNNNVFDEAVLATASDFPDPGDGGTGVADYMFPFVTASRFELRLMSQDGNGPRVTEIDAIVPEPSALGWTAMTCACILSARRRRRASATQR
jgi:hypothetical protein